MVWIWTSCILHILRHRNEEALGWTRDRDRSASAQDPAALPAGLELATGEREVPGIDGLGCCEDGTVI